MQHAAVVSKIHTRPTADFDNLLIASCGPYQLLVGKDHADGELGVFFDSELQLSEEFAAANDLIAVRDPETGVKLSGGMFEPNRRVRCIKIRGVKSEGFWCPLSYFDYTGYNTRKLQEGDQFDQLNGHPICNKYITPQTARAQRHAQRAERVRLQNLRSRYPEHQDTAHFKREAYSINPGAHLYLTWKLHGTSGRYAHLQVDRRIQRSKLGQWWARLRKKPSHTTNWEHLNGTRRVVLYNLDENLGWYGRHDFRKQLTENIVLHKGEVLYFEIVGYVTPTMPIMGEHRPSKLRDKTLSKRYPDPMVYSYGCVPGACRMYLYHIAYVLEDGMQIDLTWPQVKRRALELGLNTVPEIEHLVFDGDHDALLQHVAHLVDGPSGTECSPSVLDVSHIEEGAVVRVEDPVRGIRFLKYKNFVFGVLEGYLKEDDEYVDMEEAQTSEDPQDS